ncbi:MAG TPA: YSC84-related protein [Chthoniobacterales bacterium]|nr:YSC84-related protein [Chthoniobacterales bacterium]
MKHHVMVLIVCAFGLGTAQAFTEQEIVNADAQIIREFRRIPEQQIPETVLSKARGLAIIKVLKIGFGVSGKGGEGVVVARTGHDWAGPSFIGTGGAGIGFQIGAEVTDFVFVLNNEEAVRAFSHGGNVKIGADASAAAGPVGRHAEADVMPTAAIYTYSRSKGLFAGVSLQGAVIATQTDANSRYYGRPVTAAQILSGKVSPPAGAARLLSALGR